MGNDNTKENPNAYPHQQYEHDKQQQLAQQKQAQTHHHHHHHQHHADPIQPKPNPPPQQIQQVQYIPVQPHPNQPINPYYGAQPVQPIKPVTAAFAVNTAQNTIPQQTIQPQPIQQPQTQSMYPSLPKPAQQQPVQQIARTAAIAGTATTAAVIAANNNQPQQQQQPQPQQQQPVAIQQQPTAPIVPIATTAAATGAVIASQQRPNATMHVQQAGAIPTTMTATAQPIQPQPIQTGYVQVQGADGKQYIVPQGPPGTVPVVVQPKPKVKPTKPVVKKTKYKTWGVKIVPTSDKAKNKVRNHQYESTQIVIGIVCDGDKYDGYNRYGGYGGYGHSSYGDLDQKKFITMKVRVTDQIAIQQNKDKHYLEFWKNGTMFNKVIALDPHKKFQIRVGSTNHDYDVKLY